MHEVFTRKQVHLSPFWCKSAHKFLFFMESQLCFYCVVSIYIPPPYQDEDLVMLDRDQDHFWISNYEENEIDLNLVIIIRVGFQVQVYANVSTFWPCCFATMFQLYKITLAREQNNTPHIPKIIMISVLTKDKIYPINFSQWSHWFIFDTFSDHYFWNEALHEQLQKDDPRLISVYMYSVVLSLKQKRGAY